MSEVIEKRWERTLASVGNAGTLIMVRGIPGAGKSTLANKLVQNDPRRVHIETDMFFTRYGDYQWSVEELGRAHRWCLTTVEALLQSGRDVVISNTFTQYKEMVDYVGFAKRFDISVEVITMLAHYGSIHNVPEEAMQRMRDRFQSHESIIEKIRAL